MKTLYVTDSSSNIAVDPEIDAVDTLRCEDRYDIRSIYYAEEPMHVVYNYGERKEEIDARKGDIIIVFYNNRYNKYILDTVRSKQWAANIKNRHKIEQQEREEWAAKQKDVCENCSCPCCDAAPEPVAEEPAPKKASAADKIKKILKKVKKG